MRHVKPRFFAATMVMLLIFAPPLLAGPLDRSDMGPRVNPATNDMLRVPGVVGMDPQSALAELQQAGLNPRVHSVQRTIKKYAGQEGTVVKQMPAAGGMAMLGSSVSITVYEPGGTAPGADSPDQGAPPTEQGGYDGGDASTPASPPQEGGGDGGMDNGGSSPVQLPSGDGWQGPTQAPVVNPPVPAPIARPTVPASPAAPVAPEPVPTPTRPVKPEGHSALLSPHQGDR